MSSLSIKVNIAGRTYPLTIQMEEEEHIRKAASDINDTLQYFQENYAVKDRQDLLAMTALQLLSKSMMQNQSESIANEENQLSELNNTLQSFLEKTA